VASHFLRRMSIFEDGPVHALQSQKERLASDAKPRPVLTGLSPKFFLWTWLPRGSHEEAELRSVNLDCLDIYRRSSEYEP